MSFSIIKDHLGRNVQIEQNLNRIISLVPSQTETILELSNPSILIGRTKFCIHPRGVVEDIQKIGGTKNLNLDLIRSIKPQLIIANKEENNKDQVLACAEFCPVWVSDIKSPEDGIKLINDFGVILQAKDKANALIKAIATGRKVFDQRTIQTKRAAYLIWKDPFMSVGKDTYIHHTMKSAGFINIFADQYRYPSCTLDEIIERHPEIILLSSEPFPFKEKHISELSRYIPETKIILVDGEMFSWYGSKMRKAYPYFSEIHSKLSSKEN